MIFFKKILVTIVILANPLPSFGLSKRIELEMKFNEGQLLSSSFAIENEVRIPESIKDAEIEKHSEVYNEEVPQNDFIEKQKNIEDEYDRINAEKKITEPSVTPDLIRAKNRLDEFLRNN